MTDQHHNYSLAIAILADEKGQAFVNKAIQLGLNGGFVTSAKGMIESKILNSLGIHNQKRQAVFIHDTKEKLASILPQLETYFKMKQPNHGVIFLIHSHHVLNQRHLIDSNEWQNHLTDYQLVLTTFRHERRIEITNKLKELGASGGTLLTGRGQFTPEAQKMLGIQMTPQKDILFTVSPSDSVSHIFKGLDDTYHFNQTKGMRMLSIDVPLFSHAKELSTHPTIVETEMSMLVSIISEELKSDYLDFIHQQGYFGGTAMKAHGTLSEANNQKIFNMTINPQKFILFTVDTTENINKVFHELIDHPHLNQNYQSLFFTLPINRAYGIN